jgi:hypothetical protein
MKTFETKLTRLKNTLDKALEAKTVRAACLLLEKELGPDFPIPPETDSESNAKNLNQAFIKGGLTLTTPNAYEALPVKNRGGFYGYNPFMERRGLIQFDGLKQMPELTALEKSGFIHQFAHSYDGHIAVLKYAFRLKEITFQFGNQTITNDFSKYGIEIIYGGTTLPKVFVTTVSIDPKCPHCFEDGALCLYHSKNFKWSNNHSIAKDIFPLICTWLYFYEQWQLTGIWLGNEAKH